MHQLRQVRNADSMYNAHQPAMLGQDLDVLQVLLSRRELNYSCCVTFQESAGGCTLVSRRKRLLTWMYASRVWGPKMVLAPS